MTKKQKEKLFQLYKEIDDLCKEKEGIIMHSAIAKRKRQRAKQTHDESYSRIPLWDDTLWDRNFKFMNIGDDVSNFFLYHNPLAEELSGTSLINLCCDFGKDYQGDTTQRITTGHTFGQLEEKDKTLYIKDISLSTLITKESHPQKLNEYRKEHDNHMVFYKKTNAVDCAYNHVDDIMHTPFLYDGSVELSSDKEQQKLDELWLEIDKISNSLRTTLYQTRRRQVRSEESIRMGSALRSHTYHYDSAEFPLVDYANWKDTFFYRHQTLAEMYSRTGFNKNFIDSARASLFREPSESKNYINIIFLANVEAIIPSEKGPRLLLSDPYGELLTDAIEDLDTETSLKLIDHVIRISIGITKQKDQYPVRFLHQIGHKKKEPLL